ncbi:putative short-chain dehydrogenase [Rosellinia necatrix]|uniref:Putative short-chain dehydrogenase n=1 Tax=Rosellinia necatrix TaxID=77044 RepID=A0A1W2TX02_ROSNE|nr:putative short-chain dehydrogenase [Rosellinia necatrix]
MQPDNLHAMAGTIIITGANGSIAVHAVQRLLDKAPGLSLILTVRNASDTDPNTKRLREVVGRFPSARASVRELDLVALRAVHDFADAIAGEISQGELPPLAAIVCNAFHWNMVAGPELTEDGLEKTIQVNHVSHSALVLRLLGSFGPKGGRVVLFTSDSHYPRRNSLERYPPGMPDVLDDLIGASLEKTDKQGRGFQNYANSKLAILMWTYALNRYLEKHESLSEISAVVVDPGTITDSRALRTNTPAMLSYMQRFVLQPLRPVLRLMVSDVRGSADAGIDVADLALNQKHSGRRGYFRLMVPGPSSAESLDETKQDKLWRKTAEWAKLPGGGTAFEGL